MPTLCTQRCATPALHPLLVVMLAYQPNFVQLASPLRVQSVTFAGVVQTIAGGELGGGSAGGADGLQSGQPIQKAAAGIPSLRLFHPVWPQASV